MNQKPKHVTPNGAMAMTVIATLLGRSLEDTAAGGRTNNVRDGQGLLWVDTVEKVEN
jgi:hypothetical protein